MWVGRTYGKPEFAEQRVRFYMQQHTCYIEIVWKGKVFDTWKCIDDR